MKRLALVVVVALLAAVAGCSDGDGAGGDDTRSSCGSS